MFLWHTGELDGIACGDEVAIRAGFFAIKRARGMYSMITVQDSHVSSMEVLTVTLSALFLGRNRDRSAATVSCYLARSLCSDVQSLELSPM